jgi:hypothetical protein
VTEEKKQHIQSILASFPWIEDSNLFEFSRAKSKSKQSVLTVSKDNENNFGSFGDSPFEGTSQAAERAYETLLIADGKFPDGSGAPVEEWALELLGELIALFDWKEKITASLRVSHPTGEQSKFGWTASKTKRGALKISWFIDDDDDADDDEDFWEDD